MKITILGPAHPYRGGLASIMEIMARTFRLRGNEVDIKTFTLQYPSLLFPGKSQTVDTPPPADLDICRCVNTVNPFNWLRVGRRIRRARCGDETRYYYTEKTRVTAVTRIEREHEITAAEFEALLSERDEALRTIEKTRYLVPFEGHTLEIDVFPFWRDRAFCECELQSEDEPLPLPDWLHVYREVTDDPRYTNRALARSVPDEIL